MCCSFADSDRGSFSVWVAAPCPGRGSLRPPAPVRCSARASLRTHFRGDPPLTCCAAARSRRTFLLHKKSVGEHAQADVAVGCCPRTEDGASELLGVRSTSAGGRPGSECAARHERSNERGRGAAGSPDLGPICDTRSAPPTRKRTKQHTFSAPPIRTRTQTHTCAAPSISGSGGLRGDQREPHREGAANVLLALDEYLAAMQLDQMANAGQAEPFAGDVAHVAPAAIAFEHVREILRGNPTPRSRTRSSAHWRSSVLVHPTQTVTAAPGGLYFAALPIRLRSTRAMRAGSASTITPDSDPSQRTSCVVDGGSAATTCLTQCARSTRSRFSSSGTPAAARVRSWRSSIAATASLVWLFRIARPASRSAGARTLFRARRSRMRTCHSKLASGAFRSCASVRRKISRVARASSA